MDESTTYKNRDEQIKTFEEVLQKEEINDEFKSGVVTNQIKDNKASSFAKTVGSLIASIIRYGINILNDFFELITKI